MSRLIKASLKTMLSKKETIIFLAFSLFPLAIIIVNLFKTNFMQLSAPKDSMSFLAFFQVIESVQYQMTLPLIVIIYLAATSMHDEIISGILYLYKDISRNKILNSKLCSLVIIYFIYLGLTFVFSLITYYVSLIHMTYASGKFMPNGDNLTYIVFGIIGVVMMYILIITLAITLSTRFNNGITLLFSIVFALFSFIAPQLRSLKYIFPNSYENLYSQLGATNAGIIICMLFIIYTFVFVTLAHSLFKRVEY